MSDESADAEGESGAEPVAEPTPPSDPVDAASLVEDRAERLDAYLDAQGFDAVWFGEPNSFAWATGGGSNVVSREGATGVGAVGYDADGEWHLATDNIEAERLLAEELVVDARVHEHEWHEGSLASTVAAATPGSGAADFAVPGLERVDAAGLHQPLCDGDVERYRELGRVTAEVLEAVCRRAAPDDTEADLAAGLRGGLEARDVAAPVALVGGAERAGSYRHFTPKDVELGEYAIASVTAEWKGLHASATRTVAFDPPEWLDDRHTRCMFMEATGLGATHAVGTRGGVAGSVFEGIARGYEHFGEPEEWRKHHQGGATGYAGREWFVAPGSDEPIRLPGAFAYNPTIRGAKSEDTVLLTEDGVEVLTSTGEWPVGSVDAYDYDLVIYRPQVLALDR
jgi:Xaa-Pro aminopeptidase